MVKSCVDCLGKYGGPFTHSHTSTTVYDSRFRDCQLCHGQGAVVCETCQGTGRLVLCFFEGNPVWAPDHEGWAMRNAKALESMVASQKGMTPARPEGLSDVGRLDQMVRKGLASDYEKK